MCYLRKEGEHSDEEIAEKLRFKSVDHMRRQLENWSVPDWLIGDKRATNSARTPQARKGGERRARGSGPTKELPPASNATPLFREKLEALVRGNEELRYRKARLQGGLFVESRVYPDPAHVHLKHVPKELLQRDAPELEDQGATHASGFLFKMGEGTPSPQAPLPTLIAAYVLMDGAIEPLLEALYPGTPPTELTEKIKKRVEDKKSPRTEDGLKALASQLARLVCGGDVRKGRDPAVLPAREYALACRISERREAGFADDEIRQELNLSQEEFRRLAGLESLWPWT